MTFSFFFLQMRREESLLECIAKLRPRTFNKYPCGKVVHVKTWSRKGTAVSLLFIVEKNFKKLSFLISWIIATFTFEVFLHIVECIVTVQQMVEYITLHMGSANNCYPEVFLDVFLFFVFHLLTWITLFRKWSHLWWECWQGPKLFW